MAAFLKKWKWLIVLLGTLGVALLQYLAKAPAPATNNTNVVGNKWASDNTYYAPQYVFSPTVNGAPAAPGEATSTQPGAGPPAASQPAQQNVAAPPAAAPQAAHAKPPQRTKPPAPLDARATEPRWRKAEARRETQDVVVVELGGRNAGGSASGENAQDAGPGGSLAGEISAGASATATLSTASATAVAAPMSASGTSAGVEPDAAEAAAPADSTP